MIKVASTFTGGGGLDRLFHKSKHFDVVCHIENDKFASAVLEYHHPDTPNLGDITELDPIEVPDHDLLIGGFPCTDISTQGKQKGMKEGKKSGLYNYLLPIIDVKKPKFLLFENVKNLLSKQMEKDLTHVKKTIASRGYRFKIVTIDSSNFRTSQQRVRIFIIGIRQDIKVRKSDFEYALSRSYQGKNISVDPRFQRISWSKSSRSKLVDVEGVLIPEETIEEEIKWTDYRIREDNLINTLTTGPGCKGASTGTMVLDGNFVRDMNPVECERLMYWPTTKLNVNFTLCLDGVKNLVSAVSQNPKLLKPVSSAEKIESKRVVKLVAKALNVKSPLIRSIVQDLVTSKIPSTKSESEKLQNSETQKHLIANSVELKKQLGHLKISQDVVQENVTMSIIEGNETQIGKVALHQNVKRCTQLKSGSKLLKLSGKETMEIAKNASFDSNTDYIKPLSYIISSPLGMRSIDLIQLIWYCYAVIVTYGFTQKGTLNQNLSVDVLIRNGYTKYGIINGKKVEISKSQRYKIIGNGVVSSCALPFMNLFKSINDNNKG